MRPVVVLGTAPDSVGSPWLTDLPEDLDEMPVELPPLELPPELPSVEAPAPPDPAPQMDGA